ncbi:c-type cytochrome biogenesis protein CcmI [Shewanella sp. NIFS-20-20]|uniref:c-type cytochrome biogenesis protein CcmI n=1 Tax=Shewanella sp. NIFS-20-20 TaxID=2853806 RepID=UPI001C459754|nr:c-type cytochrome biogenesis protein CcmI [Shewanella sp. NIFS-20-20]MBV7317604.1 c-type cytochrome biogenesis protein CcmI [Shewanella sp. NIFS-20-20]
MTTFWIFIALVVLVSLLLIWVPHFRQQKLLRAEAAGIRNQTNIALFNERLMVLEKELQDELLDEQEFAALKQELEISLLQDMKQGSDESLTATIQPKSILIPSMLSVVLVGIAAYAYQHLGAYQMLNQPMNAANPHAGMTPEQIMSQQVMMMEQQIQAQPDNSQAWFNLGHAYISANRYDDAIKAFDKVIDLVGLHAELIGPKATALYYKNNQQMTPDIQALIDKALSLDPQDPSTLLLVGMNAFFNANYNAAIDAWQTILNSDRTDIDRSAVINAIETAKMRLGAESGEMPQDATHQQASNESAMATSAASNVTIAISIAPELADQVGPTDMLFVFARPVDGAKVPLAATKISAKALPANVILDDTTHMGGDMKLSDATAVEIIAVLSKHGSVRPQPGDLQGKLANVSVGGNGTLVIDTLVQ